MKTKDVKQAAGVMADAKKNDALTAEATQIEDLQAFDAGAFVDAIF